MLTSLDLHRFAGRQLESLSGGERQRVFLARALAQGAKLLLLDEPTSALDIGHQQDVLELVDGLRRDRGLTVLATMHDLSIAGEYADRMVLLADGRVVATGTPSRGAHRGAARPALPRTSAGRAGRAGTAGGAGAVAGTDGSPATAMPCSTGFTPWR